MIMLPTRPPLFPMKDMKNPHGPCGVGVANTVTPSASNVEGHEEKDMRTDRELQQKALILLNERFPKQITDEDWQTMLALAGGDEEHLVGNLKYLEECGYIMLGLTEGTDSYGINLSAIRITQNGVKFLNGKS